MQFGFMPGRCTTDANFILRQLHEKYLRKKKNIYFPFVTLEKVFDRVPCRILWWAMQRLRIDEQIIQLVKSMYDNAHSKVRITNSYINPVNILVGAHQGSVLSPLLFIIIMKALSLELRTGCPYKLFYASELAIVAKSLSELKVRLKKQKDRLEQKELKVNIGKTKAFYPRHDVSKPKIASVKFPCGASMKGVGVIQSSA